MDSCVRAPQDSFMRKLHQHSSPLFLALAILDTLSLPVSLKAHDYQCAHKLHSPDSKCKAAFELLVEVNQWYVGLHL